MRYAKHRPRGRLKKTVAELLIRLEIRPLCPLVPGVDEQQSVISVMMTTCVVEQASQPDLVMVWRCPVINVAVDASSGRVVPTGHHPAIHRQANSGAHAQAVADELRVRANLSLELPSNARSLVGDIGGRRRCVEGTPPSRRSRPRAPTRSRNSSAHTRAGEARRVLPRSAARFAERSRTSGMRAAR